MFAYVTGTLRYVLQNHSQDSYHTITPFFACSSIISFEIKQNFTFALGA